MLIIFRFSFIALLLFAMIQQVTGQQLSAEIKNALKEDNSQAAAVALEGQHLDLCYEVGNKTYNLLALSIKINAKDVLAYLLDAGANIEAYCEDKTPLMYAVKYGKLDMVKMLVEKGADPSFVLEDQAAIDYAIQYRHPEILSYLKSLGGYRIYDLEGVDGPYVFDDKAFFVNEALELERKQIDRTQLLRVKVGNKDQDEFDVQLKEIKIPEAVYPKASKVIVISDIEGNFNGFYSFLLNNGVMDEAYNWTYEDGHLVLVGDFVDRGEAVTPVLWLIYHLESKAAEQGGQVHFILGNHEIMNIQGDVRYVQEKYIGVAQQISSEKEWETAYQYLFSDQSELGAWWRSKNVIEKVGDYLFVHAGLSPEILQYRLSINQINEIARRHLEQDLYARPSQDEQANFIMGAKGPLWYRGLLGDYKDYYERAKKSDLKRILKFYDANKMVIGHTVVEDISTDYDGLLIRVDVKHNTNKASGKTKGLLIEKGVAYKVDDLGKRAKL
ncbi:MAG: metallophosphoesterase [Bacteroidota bacterium]